MKRELQLANFAELNPNPIIELGLDGEILYANLTARTQFPDLFSAGLAHPILSGLEKIIQDFHPNQQSEFIVYNREVTFKSKSYEQQIFALPGTGIYIYIIDITEQNLLKSQAHFNDKMVTIGILAAGVAHEINNPITWLLGNLSLLQDKVITFFSGSSDPGQHELCTKIEEIVAESLQGVEQIRDIARSLKELARIDKAEIRPVDIHKVLHLTITMASIEFKNRARLEMHFAENLPMILSNSGKLHQVFLNLLINAAQAIPSGSIQDNKISVSTQVDKSRIRIDIADTGQGIPADVLPRIFDSFFTTKPAGQGTGLGLSICREIIRELNGEIQVQSTVGQGTTFSVYLPMQFGALESEAPPGATVAHSLKKSILVVDNEPALLKLLQRVLAERHQVTTALGGTAAEELIAKNRGQFDLIISDLNMPDVTGADLYEVIIQKYPELRKKFIFITGGVDVPWAKEFLARAGVPVLEKPFLPKDLLNLVDSLV